MKTGDIIKKLRLQANLSQHELAIKAGYNDRSSIAKIESGKVDLPESKIMIFSEIFNVAPSEIMGISDRLSESSFIRSLGRMMERRELTPEVDAVNALISSKGWRIEKYEDGSYGLMLERGDVLDQAHMDALVEHLEFMTQAVVYLYLNDDSDMILPKLRGDAEWMLKDCRRRKVGFQRTARNEREP